jgi:ribosomal protein S18 acetylase RimI-like enzyme
MALKNMLIPLIIEIGDPDLERVENLWKALYEEQITLSPDLILSIDGFADWANTFRNILGRFGFVLAAECDGALLGFIAGRIKLPTPPFQAVPVGFISEVFVDASHRGIGIGKKLVQAAEAWFCSNEIKSMELQVLHDNSTAQLFYQSNGWNVSLLHMTRLVLPKT